MIKVTLFIVGLLLALPNGVSATLCGATGDASGLYETEATPFLFQFASGAQWQMCWHIDEQAGLVLSRVYYGAPYEAPRQLLDAASLSQILFKYDEDTHASHLLSETGLGGAQYHAASAEDCVGGELLAGVDGGQLCQRFQDLNHLTKVRRTESIRRHQVSLHARSTLGAHQYEQVWRFSEDGEITPAVLFSGSITRYTNDARYGVRLDSVEPYASSAVLLVNWRMDFNIAGTRDNDLVDEIEFTPFETNKRAISTTPLTTEIARKTNNVDFRGWRISDAEVSSGVDGGAGATTRVGYYLDPQSAGYRFVSMAEPWTQTDFFVTKKNDCETLASLNRAGLSACAESLDEFVNHESLIESDVVTWFSVSRQFTPRLEDVPAIATREISFKLIPFDWSAKSPFESLPVNSATNGVP